MSKFWLILALFNSVGFVINIIAYFQDVPPDPLMYLLEKFVIVILCFLLALEIHERETG